MTDVREYFISIEDNENLTLNKYASKTNNFYNELELFQKDKKVSEYKIKPIQVTLEITNRCNCNCPNCGMSANFIKGKTEMYDSEIMKIIDDMHRFGILSIAYTGGEPFLLFDMVCNMIRYSQGKVDTIKIISNGFWGQSADYYFEKMISAGILNNKIMIPSIYVSIGEQNVKLEIIADLINYVVSNNLTNDINFGIVNTRHFGENYSQLEKLVAIYEEKFETFPKEKLYLTDSNYVNDNKLAKTKTKTIKNNVYNLLECCDNKFDCCIGKFVSPKILVKCNGDCYPCEVFNLHKDFFLGNIFESGLDVIVKNFNNNTYTQFINEFGVANFRNVIPKNILKNKQVETVCQACEFCAKYCSQHNLIKY